LQVAFHDLVLSLDGEGGWAVYRGKRAAERDGNDTDAAYADVAASSSNPADNGAACFVWLQRPPWTSSCGKVARGITTPCFSLNLIRKHGSLHVVISPSASPVVQSGLISLMAMCGIRVVQCCKAATGSGLEDVPKQAAA
jgi:hypothetical protein